MAAAGPSLSPSPTPIALEQDHRTTAQSPDLWRDQLRRAGVDKQRRARSAEHVDRLSADVHRGLCTDPVVGPPVRELSGPGLTPIGTQVPPGLIQSLSKLRAGVAAAPLPAAP